MSRHDLILSYDTCNAIGQRYQKQIRCLSLILLSISDIFIKENPKVLQ